MADLSQWSETAASNNVTSPAGAQSGWTGSEVGPWARETMAAVRRFYGDPTWITTLNDHTPSGTAKTVTRSDDNTFTIFASGMTDPSSMFPVGRLIRVRSASDSTPCFVVSTIFETFTLTVDVACAARASDATAVLPGTGSEVLSDDGVDFFSAQDDSATYQALGAPAFGGGGTTTVRDAKYPSATDLPDGILWSNTTTAMLEATKSDAWVAIAPNTDAFSDGGGKLTLTSTTNSQIDLKSVTGEDASVILQENSIEMSALKYDADLDQTILDGNPTGNGGRIYIKDDGGLFWKPRSLGDLGAETDLLLRNNTEANYILATYDLSQVTSLDANCSVGVETSVATIPIPSSWHDLDGEYCMVDICIAYKDTGGTTSDSRNKNALMRVYLGASGSVSTADTKVVDNIALTTGLCAVTTTSKRSVRSANLNMMLSGSEVTSATTAWTGSGASYATLNNFAATPEQYGSVTAPLTYDKGAGATGLIPLRFLMTSSMTGALVTFEAGNTEIITCDAADSSYTAHPYYFRISRIGAE